MWQANQSNDDENFWQKTLEQYPFVLSQVFSAPVVILQGKAYVGGKSLEGVGGRRQNHILKNVVTEHALLVEIKTPSTKLMLQSPYRPPDVYAVSSEVAGMSRKLPNTRMSFSRTSMPCTSKPKRNSDWPTHSASSSSATRINSMTATRRIHLSYSGAT